MFRSRECCLRPGAVESGVWPLPVRSIGHAMCRPQLGQADGIRGRWLPHADRAPEKLFLRVLPGCNWPARIRRWYGSCCSGMRLRGSCTVCARIVPQVSRGCWRYGRGCNHFWAAPGIGICSCPHHRGRFRTQCSDACHPAYSPYHHAWQRLSLYRRIYV